MAAIFKASDTKRELSVVGAVLLTLMGLAGSFGLASCCALPLLLATVGIGSAWLGGIALLATAHRSLLLAVSAASLIGGAGFLLSLQSARSCMPDSICSRPLVRALTFLGLLFGFVLLYFGYNYV